MQYRWLLPLLDLLQQLPRVVLRTTTNLLDQEDCYGISLLKKIAHVIFAVTDNHKKFLKVKIFRYTELTCKQQTEWGEGSVHLCMYLSLLRVDFEFVSAKIQHQVAAAVAARVLFLHLHQPHYLVLTVQHRHLLQ